MILSRESLQGPEEGRREAEGKSERDPAAGAGAGAAAALNMEGTTSQGMWAAGPRS